jgi:dihydrofolate reductase
MTVSVFIGTSVDGFIARPNGALDFLPEGGGEPHGYNEFIASIDALVIGRKTFETVLAFPEWPYGEKRVVVLSSRPVDLSSARGAVVQQMSGPPAEIVAKLAASGAQHLYVDGGITIQKFLRAGLIQRFIITRVPVLIGDGIPSSAPCRGMCGSDTWRRSTIRADWSRASIMSPSDNRAAIYNRGSTFHLLPRR